MHPFEKESSGRLPQGVSAHLDVRLKPGWHFDADQRAFVSEDQKVSLKGKLPARTKVKPVAPRRAVRSASQSADEDLLGRSLTVVVPSGVEAEDLAATLRGIHSVESANVAPILGLPSAHGM